MADAKASTLVPQAELKALLVLDETLRDGRKEIATAEKQQNEIAKGIMLARLHQNIRQQLTPAMLKDVKELMNTPLGFRTDRDPARQTYNKAKKRYEQTEPYSDDVIRDVVITALLDGARLVGNEFNILAKGYYRTVEQLKRRIDEFPDIEGFRYQLSVPVMGKGGALVAGWAAWRFKGDTTIHRLDCAEGTEYDTRIAIRVNEGQGSDAILGKARRKLFYRVLERMSGEHLADDFDPDEPESLGTEVIDATLYTVEQPETKAKTPTSPQVGMSQQPMNEAAELARQRFDECDSQKSIGELHEELVKADKSSSWEADIGMMAQEARERVASNTTG